MDPELAALTQRIKKKEGAIAKNENGQTSKPNAVSSPPGRIKTRFSGGILTSPRDFWIGAFVGAGITLILALALPPLVRSFADISVAPIAEESADRRFGPVTSNPLTPPPAPQPKAAPFPTPGQIMGNTQQMFDDIDKMMNEQMKDLRKMQDDMLDESYGVRVNAGDINARSDDKNYYYDVNIKGLDKESVKVRVVNRLLVISGMARQNFGQQTGMNISFSASFQRSLNLPPDADHANPKIEQSRDRVTVILKRRS